jgi:hypothetical protein
MHMQRADEQLLWLVDRAAIIDVIVAIANAFDAQDWARLRPLLMDELDIDYSQFRNEPAARISADAYVDTRRRGLTGVRTLHISTNHQVSVAGDAAECVSAYRIYRVNPQLAPGENRLDTAGTYHHSLLRTAVGWRVSSITQSVLIQGGNPLVHGALRPAESPRSE